MALNPNHASPPSHILIVEDDAKIADMVANYLQAQGYLTRIVADGEVALQDIVQSPPDLVLLDLMLPGLDGLEVCRKVRRFSRVPIIMVTARVEEIDRLLGLDLGADDYVCKPFSPRELAARVRALLRRSSHQAKTPGVSSGSGGDSDALPGRGLTAIVDVQRVVWREAPGAPAVVVPLTPLEFRLFRVLAARPGHVFARSRLLDAVHQEFRDVSDRAIDSHVKNLRRKLEITCGQADLIVSVYGAGYRYDPDAGA
jgi:two-component system, OmpR family, response regulator BaeR